MMKHPLHIVIADDERPARGELGYLIQHIPGVEVIGQCANGQEVLDFLSTHPHVDLLFLDIEMPLLNGLETARRLLEKGREIPFVFATGYSQFAVEAFSLEAFDYILKPYDQQRIRRIIERLQASRETQARRAPGEIVREAAHIGLRSEGKTVFLKAEDILLVATEKSDSSFFYTESGIVRSKITLREAEQILLPHGFFRTHKGYLVNMAMVEKAEPEDNGILLLTVKGYPKEKVPVSRHYVKDFKQAMGMGK